MASGTYQYSAIWEWYDAEGTRQQSATAVPVSAVVTGPTGSVALTITAPPLTMRSNQSAWLGVTSAGLQSLQLPNASLVLYRTTAGGTIFYRHVSLTGDPSTVAAAIGGVPITLTDQSTDATLTSVQPSLLYTTGGVLDNFNPPGARCIVAHKQRVFVAGCDNPNQIWPSSQIVSGIAPGWNEAIAFPATGSVRALASMDDKLVIFVQRGAQYGIEYVTGDGPTNLGTQSDWTPPQAIASDVGAVDQRSVVSGPFGVLFRSPVGGPNGSGGIHLLSRDLQVTYLSSTVEDTLASFPSVTSMVLHPNAGRVYITCVANDYATPLVGVRLVWDYVMGVWSADAISDPDNSQVGTAGARSACVAQTPNGLAYHWVSQTGRVYRETNGVGASSYTDAGTWITAKVQTAWQKVALDGALQIGEVQLQADTLDPADLTLTLTFDYSPTYTETNTWAASAIATFDRAPQVDVSFKPRGSKVKSVQLTLQDAPPTGATATTGQGFSWATMTVEAEQDEGAYPNLPAAQRY